jgi:hypothetical protein
MRRKEDRGTANGTSDEPDIVGKDATGYLFLHGLILCFFLFLQAVYEDDATLHEDKDTVGERLIAEDMV